MKKFILVYFNAAALACIAEAAAAEAGKLGQIITQEQITGYAKVLGNNAFKIKDRVVMKLECEEIPAPYQQFAEAIYESRASNLVHIKSVRRDAHVTGVAMEADSERYMYMKLSRTEAKAEKVEKS